MKGSFILAAAIVLSGRALAVAAQLDWSRDPGPQFKELLGDGAPAAPGAVQSNSPAVAAGETTRLEKDTEDAVAAWGNSRSPELWRRLQDLVRRHELLLAAHPDDAGLHLSYGNLLGAMGRDYEDKSVEEWDKARTLDPSDPDAWNNLANYYGHRSPVKKAFEYYEKAISLNPNEPVYSWNFATTVFLFRKDAMDYYSINEQQVFDKALGLYRQALALAPSNYELACDLAISYYGIKPDRAESAIADWSYALKIVPSDLERQHVQLHLARWEIKAGHPERARGYLDAVTDPGLQATKAKIARKL